MANKLVDLEIVEVSAVDHPANKRKFLVVKRAKQTLSDEEIKKFGDEFWNLHKEDYPWDKCVEDQMGKGHDKESANNICGYIKRTYGKREKGELPMITKEQIAKIADAKIQEAVVQQQEEMVALEAKNKAQEAEIAKLKEGKTDGGDTNDEAIWKGVPPAIRNRFDAITRERDEMQKKAKEEKDAREIGVWTTKCAGFKYLQITPEHFGKVMKNVAEHCPTEAEEILRILGVADGLIDKGTVFAEIGKSNGDVSRRYDANSVTARVEAMAEDFIKLDSKLPYDQAIQKVFKQNPEWYDAWRRENQVNVTGR